MTRHSDMSASSERPEDAWTGGLAASLRERLQRGMQVQSQSKSDVLSQMRYAVGIRRAVSEVVRPRLEIHGAALETKSFADYVGQQRPQPVILRETVP